MTDYIRRLVSGNKARFKDRELNLELDLVYVTDQVIIMGYPASGIEGLYRNRREDAKRFLDARHGKNYWVFNFCPLKENSYESDIFEGRVSRYPFPDHHAPPLVIMPLVAREMDAWLSGSPDRVAVLHCKAGKGRSGTMACTYLLSLGDVPQPPQLERNQTAKERAKRRIEDALDILPPDEENQPPVASRPTSPPFVTPAIGTSDTAGTFDAESGGRPFTPTAGAEKSFTDSLKGVLDLHTARRMKPPSEQDGKAKQGVSIPSQRRFLYYWALILAHEAPSHLWGLNSLKSTNINLQSSFLDKNAIQRPKVRLTQLNIRMRETSNMKMNFVKAANMVIERTNMAKAPENTSTQLWASMARYDDKMVDLLEEWEAYTRDSSGNMGKRRPGSDHLPRGESTEDEVLSHIFKTGKWDKGKMVRSFARLGVTDSKKNEGSAVIDEKHGKIRVYALRPLSDKRWEGLKHDLHKHSAQNNDEHQTIEANATTLGVSRSEANSINEVAPKDAKVDHKIENGIILDAAREVRIKLYMGQVFMGWFWFIPTFHMPQPPPSSTSTEKVDPTILKANMTLSRKDIDFPLGVGSAIIDIDIQMEWAMPSPPSPSAVDISNLEPPLRARTEDSKIGTDPEPEQSGLAAALQAIVSSDGMEGTGNVGVRETVEAKQGAAE